MIAKSKTDMNRIQMGTNKEFPGKSHLKPSKSCGTDGSNFQVEFLLDVIQKLSLAKDLETIMFIVRKAARTLTGADGSTFVLRDGNQCYYAEEDAIAPLWKGKRFPMSTCISGWVMEHRQSVIIEDIYSDPRIPFDAYRPTFVKSLAMVPIRTAAPLGAIGIYWAEYYFPTEEQLNWLQVLADSTSVAMENVMLQSELEKGQKETTAQIEMTRKLMEVNKNLECALYELNHRNKEMQWLKELSSTLQTCLYIKEAYHLIALYAAKLLPESSGVFYVMHPSRNYLEAMSSWGDSLIEERIIKPDDCLGLRRGSIYTVEEPQKDLICPHHKINSNLRPYTCIPLFAQSDILGLVCMEWKSFKKEAEEEINKENNQEILASMMAEQIALGISNIMLRETLRNQSLRDVLTGLYNRRYLNEALDRELNRCARKSLSLAVLMLDIDHFKQFNDKFGHEAGDMVIQAFANVLRQVTRKEDIACRYGGEEFILIIPEIDLEAALQRAQSIHDAVSRIHLRYGGNALTQITISIGLTMYPAHGNDMQDLITAADNALYEAKNSGRNKTVLYHKN
ncbi:TPA: diguanylate cyclase [Legionella pneumophila]|uniref:sensor domain-containing diguanylate cyclase n=1 Tax=Legionella pneumophila TaxID=446 RepID=UPI0004887DE2|nr:diguanylate cyclase [Legionella pneumophila]CZG97496.1 Bacteriophytochrome cph2 [Legionella pneumophila]STY14931.1 sensor histidine kinase [Legionella pneumophila]HAT1739241.1 diguanylate cyclase [Legionella pneumophila]HAT1744086.1 diguanylate cyclase [Legionella pneumophila]HAT1747341.1 diguanylate cyclase [Legionella pneumophila]